MISENDGFKHRYVVKLTDKRTVCYSYRDALLPLTPRWTRSSPPRWGSYGNHSSRRSSFLKAFDGTLVSIKCSFSYNKQTRVFLVVFFLVVFSLNCKTRLLFWPSWRRAPVFILWTDVLTQQKEAGRSSTPMTSSRLTVTRIALQNLIRVTCARDVRRRYFLNIHQCLHNSSDMLR